MVPQETLSNEQKILMAAAGQIAEKQLATKTVANYHTGQTLHGPGGMLSGEGLDQAVLTTHVKPKGLGAMLPAFESLDTNPHFFTITGVSDDIGSEPTDPCDDAPTGYIKGGSLTAQFGDVFRDTNTLELQKILLKLHRGDFTDLQMWGTLLNESHRGLYYPNNIDQAGILNLATKAEMVNAGVRMERKLSKLLWQGAIGNSTANGYKEFPGLDVQLVTGQVDSQNNGTLPSLDTWLFNANYQIVGASGFDLVGMMQNAEYVVSELADDTVDGVDGVIVMRPGAWRAVSEYWPCEYATNRCATSGNLGSSTQLVIDGRENIDMRDAMRRNMTIEINGKVFMVVKDTGIYERNNQNDANVPAGYRASDIYFIPLSIGMGLPVTFWQYINYAAAQPQVGLLGGQQQFWTDGGRFTWAYEGKKWCFKLGMRTSPRVICRTPQLAFRIQTVMYPNEWAVERDPDPQSPYWVDGGVSIRNTPNPTYAVWK